MMSRDMRGPAALRRARVRFTAAFGHEDTAPSKGQRPCRNRPAPGHAFSDISQDDLLNSPGNPDSVIFRSMCERASHPADRLADHFQDPTH